MPQDFKPSPESFSPSVSNLRYLRKAADAIEKHIKGREEDLPPWVVSQIQESAKNLGMAVSYLQFAKSKEKS